jgi:hypothetical protein
VFVFDTPDLRLNKSGVVVRARRVQGRGDVTVVRLRPIVPGELAQPAWAVRHVAVENCAGDDVRATTTKRGH